jgi:hypothetical protein
MARVRFIGPPNPDPDGNDLGHVVPLLARTVTSDELVDVPGDLVAEEPDAWVLGDAADEDNRYVLPKSIWRVEDTPAKPAGKKE